MPEHGHRGAGLGDEACETEDLEPPGYVPHATNIGISAFRLSLTTVWTAGRMGQ